MEKIIPAGSYDFGEEPTTLVKASSRGLRGDDLNGFVKRAAHAFLPYLSELRPGEVPIHALTLGATEYYGPNRNGDGFSDDALRKKHATFEKYARWFRNHVNKDTSKSYGRIVKAAYHEPMRRGEALVALFATKEAAEREGGLVADKELDALNSGQPIGTSMACSLDPDALVATVKGYREIAKVAVGDFVATGACRYRATTALNRRSYAGPTRRVRLAGVPRLLNLTADHLLRVVDERGDLQWRHVKHLTSDDRVFAPMPPRGALEATPATAFLTGWYLAAGWPTPAHRVGILCLPSLLPRLNRWLKLADAPTAALNRAGDKFYARVDDATFATLLRATTGRGDDTGAFAWIDMRCNRAKADFLVGWLCGRGRVRAGGAWWFASTLPAALSLRDLLFAIGVPATVCKSRGGRYAVAAHASTFRDAALVLGAAVDDMPRDPSPDAKPTFLVPTPLPDHRGFAIRVLTVKPGAVVDAPVYHLEVADDHTYSLGGCLSHNCRVAYDVCSVCKNQAKDRSEYCDDVPVKLASGRVIPACPGGGAMRKLGRVFENGDVLYVDNPAAANLTFFDLTNTDKPADRIAHALGIYPVEKTASQARRELAARGDEAHRLIRLSRDLAREEARIKVAHACVPLGPTAPLPPTPIGADAATLLRALTKEGAIFSLAEWASLFGGVPRGKLAAVAARLPGVFSRLDDDAALDALEYEFSGGVPLAARYWAAKAAADGRRLDERTAFKSATTLALRGVSPRAARELLGDDTTAEKVAKAYAAYQLAALGALEAATPVEIFSDMRKICARRNYNVY